MTRRIATFALMAAAFVAVAIGLRALAGSDGSSYRGASSSQVVRGSDGWLFLGADFSAACAVTDERVTQALAEWRRFLALVRRGGRSALLVVVPDKASVYVERLPPAGDRCEQRGRRRLWNALERLPSEAGVLPLRRALRTADGPEETYLRKDSHWSSWGAAAMTAGVLERLGGPVRMDRADLVPIRPVSYVGDLTRLQGAPERATASAAVVRRDPSLARVPGRAVLLGDSFAGASFLQLRSYFDDLELLRWRAQRFPAREVGASIAGADTLVVEVVERSLIERGLGPVPGLSRLLRASPRDGRRVVSTRDAAPSVEAPSGVESASVERRLDAARDACVRAAEHASADALALLCEQNALSIGEALEPADGDVARHLADAVGSCRELVRALPPQIEREPLSSVCEAGAP